MIETVGENKVNAALQGPPGGLAPMRLYWSSRSPFVRKVMIAAHELGVADRIETIPIMVTGAIPVPELERFNPLGQIPTLLVGDGVVVADSDVIIEFLDSHFGAGRLVPGDYPRRLDVLRRSALAQGALEKCLRWRGELARPAERREQKFIDGHSRSVAICLAAIEADAPRWTAMPIDAGHVGLAALLGYLDFRFAGYAWRGEHPLTAAWHAGFAQRPSYALTQFVDPR